MDEAPSQVKKERNFPTLELPDQTTFNATSQPILEIQSPKSPKTPTLSRKLKAVSLDSDPPKQSTTSLEVSRDVFSMPNTPKRQIKHKLSCEFDDGGHKSTLTPNFSSNLKKFASNTSISGSQTLKTLPEIMTLQDFSDNKTEPVKIKAKGLLERRGSNASLTIDLGSNSSISSDKPPSFQRLNSAKSVSNLNLSTFGSAEKCSCSMADRKFSERRKSQEACGNCIIYESVPSKANGCKANICGAIPRRCSCTSIKCRRKSLSNENLYVPPCGFCQKGAYRDCTTKHCKGYRKAYYPRQPDLDASQLLSEDFKMHLQNVQYLQTAGRVLSISDLKTACEVSRVPKLHSEFWEVPLNLQEKCYVSGSQSRNRYKGVLPNEHSRVHLPCAQSYIHANYIKGPDYTETAYIATQGPMAHTCQDFWEMVWHTNQPETFQHKQTCHPSDQYQNTSSKMPELTEQIYCHQQICIPPTFPYLLRQFAKAAIRTQPNDLLKWATTYFRCLSLNIPPPVKPRLEYPIPRDHHGLTPGWLRALRYQMAGSNTVTFKVLWDRWIGACLKHQNLIQILVLGGFEDNMAVPWLRFIALCAAHLTDNLTQSMILICDILTEEPEGGSAMIQAEVFIDLYEFLARIDASVPQTLRNYHFLDKFLELWQEKIARDAGTKAEEEERDDGGFSLISSESTIGTEKESKRGDESSVVSCPSVTSQDPDNYMKLLMKIQADGEFGEEEEKEVEVLEAQAKKETETEKGRRHSSIKGDESEEVQRKAETPEAKTFAEQLQEDKKTPLFPTSVQDDTSSRDTKSSSILDKSFHDEEKEREEHLLEDLEKLKSMQQELMGESDDELEKFKASILADAGFTPSQVVASEHFETKIEEVDLGTSESTKTDDSSVSVTAESEKPVVEEREYEDVDVDAVPGIGSKVPEEMIAAVVNYVKGVAKVQHNMVMPRNIRHYECPPLEVYLDRD